MSENKKKILLFSILTIVIIVFIITCVILLKDKKVSLNNNNNVTNEVTGNNQNNSHNETSEETIYDFDFSFLNLENNEKNMIYSPLSIRYALKMIESGAGGNTKKQITNALGNYTLPKYNDIKDVLSLANALYIRDTYKDSIKKEYQNILVNDYKAQVNCDSFQNANNINNWVSEKTFKQIKNIVSDKTVQDESMKMLLLNALAIDMKWQEVFADEDTYGQEFYITNNKKMTATTLHKKTVSDSVSYYQDKNITALEMDLEKYDDVQLTFLAIMPDKLSVYLKTFDNETFNNILNNLTKASDGNKEVKISIPKFSYDYSLELTKDLKSLGITDIFDEKKADFSNISNDSIFVTEALHKAKIDFSEKGIRAAAVTVIIVAGFAPEENKYVEININKPFMYLIFDKKTKDIWFVGTVYEPNSWENDKQDYEEK